MPASFAVCSPRTPAEWEAYYALRYAVLRQPWQQPLGSERCAEDEHSSTVHALVIDAGPTEAKPEALAVGMLQRGSAGQGQIRFMAVAPQQAGSGLGSRVMAYLEQEAQAAGLASLVLHSRETAIGFYERHGYRVVAPSHILFGVIPHFLMQKDL